MANDLLPLDTLGATIRAHVSKGDASIEKAEQHYKAAGIHLMEAKERVKRTANLTWPAFLNAHCDIRRRRADELIAVAEGRTSLAELNDRKNASRSAPAAERSGRVRANSVEKTQQIQQIITSQTVSEPRNTPTKGDRSRLLSEIRARLDRQEIGVLHTILALLKEE